jgi:hypothetical protein
VTPRGRCHAGGERAPVTRGSAMVRRYGIAEASSEGLQVLDQSVLVGVGQIDAEEVTLVAVAELFDIELGPHLFYLGRIFPHGFVSH